MARYEIGNQTFTSKGSIVEYCRKLKETPETEYPRGSEEYSFLIDLIQQGHLNAATKIGVGVAGFYVDVNALGVTRFMIERDDGTIIDFSYVSCKDNLGRSKRLALQSRIKRKRIEAYRDAVFDQTYGYRCSQKIAFNTWKCADCQLVSSEIVYHVDHEPDFVFLVMDFEKKWKGSLPTEFAEAEEHDFRKSVHCFRTEDKALTTEWSRYHQEHATLKMLCAPCNLKKTRYPYVSAQ